MADVIKRAYEVVLLGKFGSNSHPVHPATIHFPIAFLTLAHVLNLVYGSILYLPTDFPLTRDAQNLGSLSILGYFSNLLGIITSIPALVTGFAELYAMVSAQGLYQVDEKTGEKSLIPKVKTTLMHASLNDIVVGNAVYNWLMERNVEDYKPAGHQIVLSAGMLLLAFYAAYLGGGLVYTRGVGVQRMGTGAEEKQKEMDEYAEKKK